MKCFNCNCEANNFKYRIVLLNGKRKKFPFCFVCVYEKDEQDKIVICPKCGEERKISNVSSANYVKKNKILCRVCTSNNEIVKQKRISHLKENNPMKGRSLYSIWLEKYGKEEADKRQKSFSNISKQNYESKSLEEKKLHAEKSVRKGLKNPMYNRSIYSVWLEKYGKEIADEKMEELKKKRSKNSTGKNNPMYGKPAPIGSGNGISGWYKGWYFRSLRELSFVLDCEEKGISWVGIDNTKKFRIKYLSEDGIERSYCPDFLINNETIVEIKPKELRFLDSVLRKETAAKIWAAANGFKYEILDIEINKIKIDDLYKSGKIKFLKKYHIS